METASRQKPQPGQKRWVTTKNPWTGRKERFEIAISEQEFRDWERERIRLLGMGYPDRPPELRMFRAPAAVFHGAWQTTCGLPHAAMLVGKSDSEWLLHLFVANETSVLRDHLHRVSGAADEADIHDICRGVLTHLSPSAPRWFDREELFRELLGQLEECA